jgi:uncharacterized membrane protein
LSSGLRIGLGLLLLIVPGLIMAVRYTLTDEVAVLEAAPSVRRVLERSEQLVRGHAWGIVLVALVGYAALFATAFVAAILGELTKSWVILSAVDCVDDLAQRILSVMFVVVYFGLARPPLAEPHVVLMSPPSIT